MNIRHLGPKDGVEADSVEVIVGGRSMATVTSDAAERAPSFTVHQDVVATERLKTTQPETKMSGGLAFLENKNSLDELTVIFDSSSLGLKAGDKVFIRQNLYNASWANTIYKLDEKEFILVPRDAVLATKSKTNFVE